MTEIRVMTIEDHDGLYELWTNTPGMGLNTTDDSREGIEMYLRRNPSTSFAAVDDGKIVGAIMAGHDGRRGFIHHTAVLPDHRNQGIATRLTESAMNALAAEGIKKTALVVFGKNTLGSSFWEAVGFRERAGLVYRSKEIAPLDYLPNIYTDDSRR